MRCLARLLVGTIIVISPVVVQAGMLCLHDDLCLTDSTPTVIDGDTMKIGRQKYRLWGVDAPELQQTGGNESASCLRALIGQEKMLGLRFMGTSFDRQVVRGYWVHVSLEGGTPKVQLEPWDLGEILLSQGCVWHEWHYAPYEDSYRNTEAVARKNRIGLWAHENPVAPWDWRKQQREQKQ